VTTERPAASRGPAGAVGAPDPRDFGLVVLGATLWGTGGIAGAALAEAGGLSPVAVAAVRIAGGGILLLLVLAATRRLRVAASGAVLQRLTSVAVLLALYQAAYFSAVQAVGVGVATLVALGAAPVLVSAARSAVSRRVPEARVLGATVLALVGLVLLLVPGRDLADAGVTDGIPGWHGPALGLLAAASFAAVTLVNRRPVPGLDPVGLTAVSFTAGGLLLVPWLLIAGVTADGSAGSVDPVRAVGLAVFLAVVPTAAAWVAYFTGLRTVPATTATLVSLLEPLTAAVGATLLLGERLGPAGVVGGVLLALATVAVRPGSRRAASLAYDGRRSVLPLRREVRGGNGTDPPPSGAGR
jgi:drug/metabolite transporter, DME family